MANYRAKGGIEITDEMINQWDEDAEQGIYHGTAGKLDIKKPLSRPTLHKEMTAPADR